MAWLGLFRLLLSAAYEVAKFVNSRQLMAAGEARATAKALVEIGQRLEIGDQLRAEVEAMSDDDIDAALRGD
jgi:hypothetical protein